MYPLKKRLSARYLGGRLEAGCGLSWLCLRVVVFDRIADIHPIWSTDCFSSESSHWCLPSRSIKKHNLVVCRQTIRSMSLGYVCEGDAMPELKQTEPEKDYLLLSLTNACAEIRLSQTIDLGADFFTDLNLFNFDKSIDALLQIHKFSEPLKAVIVADSRFFGSRVRILRDDRGGNGFYPNFVGSTLIRRALQFGPAAAIKWLIKVLSTTAATGKTIQTLWGVSVREVVQLTPEVSIVPIGSVPESKQKQWLTQGSYLQGSSLVMSMLDFVVPQSALIVNRKIEPFTYDPESQEPFPNDDYIETHRLLLDIALALTVVGPREVISAPRWFTYDDQDLEYVQLGSSRSSQLIEILPNQHKEYPELDPKEAQKLVQGYLALQGKTRDKVCVALQRLSQAQRRHNVGDRAVELSTAFETLLGDDTTNEMTHKIKVRSVRILGGTDETRKRNAAVINKAYKIRSKLVHTGHVDATEIFTICGQKMAISEIIENTITMCSELIASIISRGSIPDWSIFDITEQYAPPLISRAASE